MNPRKWLISFYFFLYPTILSFTYSTQSINNVEHNGKSKWGRKNPQNSQMNPFSWHAIYVRANEQHSSTKMKRISIEIESLLTHSCFFCVCTPCNSATAMHAQMANGWRAHNEMWKLATATKHSIKMRLMLGHLAHQQPKNFLTSRTVT